MEDHAYLTISPMLTVVSCEPLAVREADSTGLFTFIVTVSFATAPVLELA